MKPVAMAPSQSVTTISQMNCNVTQNEKCIHIVIAYNDSIMIHKLDIHQSWSHILYENLYKCIKSHFQLNNEFIIRNTKENEIKTIDDIKKQYENNPNNLLFTLSVKQMTLNQTPMPRKQEKLLSLGHRLKLLSKQIAVNHNNNDYKFQLIDILKMAQVEGFDKDSYITVALKDIKRRISNKELTAVSTKIEKIISDVMPFDYQQFFELFKATQDTADRLCKKVCWVLLGPTGYT